MNISTGLANILAGGAPAQSLRSIFAFSVMRVYTLPMPADADLAETGTYLGSITLNGGVFVPGNTENGLSWDAPVAGLCPKPSGAVWKIVPVASGQAGWVRLYSNTMVLGASTTEPRIDFACGALSGEIRWSSLDFLLGVERGIDVFNLGIKRFI